MLTKAKVIKGGKISIPLIHRKSLNIKEGDEIVFHLRNNELTLTPIKAILVKVRDMINQYHSTHESLVDTLVTARRTEADNE